MSTTIDRPRPTSLSPAEKHDRLNVLTDRYLRGEIDIEEFRANRDEVSFDVEGFAAELAARKMGASQSQRATRLSRDERAPRPHVEPTSFSFVAALRKLLGLD